MPNRRPTARSKSANLWRITRLSSQAQTCRQKTVKDDILMCFLCLTPVVREFPSIVNPADYFLSGHGNYKQCLGLRWLSLINFVYISVYCLLLQKLFSPALCPFLSLPLLLFRLKGECYEIFDFRFFYESVSYKPLSIPLGQFRKFTEIFAAQGAPLVSLHRWQMKKIFNQKSFNYFLGTPLCSRINI